MSEVMKTSTLETTASVYTVTHEYCLYTILSGVEMFMESSTYMYVALLETTCSGFVQLQYEGTARTVLVDATNDRCAQCRRKKKTAEL